MSCCGKKREAMQQRRQATFGPPERPPVSVQPRTPVVFQGKGAYLIEGPYTLEIYHFPAGQAELPVDPEDAAAMVKTGLFRAKA